MKKILMLVSNIDSKRKNQFVRLIRSNFKNKDTSIEIASIKDVYIDTTKGMVVLINDKNVTEYDLIVFRGIKSREQSLASSIAMCLEYLKVEYVDRVYGEMGISEKKLGSYIKLFTSGIKMLPIYYYSGEIRDKFEKIEEALGIPFVAKDLYLQLGAGVFLIKNKEDLEKLPASREYLFQKFLDKEHEYRVLVLGNKIGVFEEKISDDPNEFRNNVALGAREVFLNKNEIPDEIRNISLDAAQVLNLQIAGVDVVVAKDGHVYIFEVNRGPGLTYDESLSPEFKEVAEYLEEYA